MEVVLNFRDGNDIVFAFHERAVTGKKYETSGACAWVKNKYSVLECDRDWTSDDGLQVYPAVDGVRIKALGEGIPISNEKRGPLIFNTDGILVLVGFKCGTLSSQEGKTGDGEISEREVK